MMDELKRCPFCGSKVGLTYNSVLKVRNLYHTGYCPEICFLPEPIEFSEYDYKTEEEVIKAWNTRKEETP